MKTHVCPLWAGYLLAEPAGHVGEAAFARLVADAETAGLRVAGRPRVAWSRAVVLERGAGRGAAKGEGT